MTTHMLAVLAFLLFSMSLYGDDRGKLKEVLKEVEGADQVLISGAFSGPGAYEGALRLHAYGEGVAAIRIYEELMKFPWRRLESNPYGGQRIGTKIAFDVILSKGKHRASLSFIGPNVFRLRSEGGDFWFDVHVDHSTFDEVLINLLLEGGDEKRMGWKLVHRRPYY